MESDKAKARPRHWFYGDSTVGVAATNLDEFPIGLLSRVVPKGLKRLEFQDEVEDESTGERVPRTLVISANVETDLPNYWDVDVQVALVELSYRQDRLMFPERVEFTIYELLHEMKLPNTTKNIRRVVKSLDNWNGVRFKYSHWWTGDAWDHPKAFVLLQDYDLSRKGLRNRAPNTPQVFTWSRRFVETMRAKRTKPFDSDFYFSLKTPTTRRMFQFLDKRLHGSVFYKQELVHFATDKIGLSRNRKPSQYPEKLSPAYEELVDAGYLANIAQSKRFQNPKYGERLFFCKRGKGRKSASQVAVPSLLIESTQDDALSGLESELVSRGVERGRRATQAGGIVSSCDEKIIKANIERFDTLKASGGKVGVGLLISQTRNGELIRLPKGVKTRSQKAADQKQKKQKRIVDAAKRHAEELESERDRELFRLKKQAVEQHLSTLSDEGRRELEAKVRRGLDKAEQYGFKFEMTRIPAIHEYLVERGILRDAA